MFDDDLPPGFSVISSGGGSTPAPAAPAPMPAPRMAAPVAAPAPVAPEPADDLPPGFSVVKLGSTLAPKKPSFATDAKPHSNAYEAARSVYPDLEITDWKRDPNSDLGRANPKSWHVRSTGAIDSRPISGMTFDEYVEGYRKQGFPIIHAQDEVNNPSSHATGPHWHVVLGEQQKPQMPLASGSLVASALMGGNQPAPDADKIGTIRQSVAAGTFSPEEGDRLIADIRAGRDPATGGGSEGGLAPLAKAASNVLFKDEAPEEYAAKLAPEKEAEIVNYARRPDVTAEMLTAFALERGAQMTNAAEIVAARDKGGPISEVARFVPPAVPANKDGAVGAATRGVADPINVLDEMGAVADTLGATAGRENIFNSDQSFGDLLYSNIDANRAILRADERDHWEARFGGQLASGLLLPFGAGARTVGQLGKFGAAEGAAAGFGAGEGNPLERVPNTAVGAGLGAVGGVALGKAFEGGAGLVSRARGNKAETGSYFRRGAYDAAPVANDGAQAAGPTPAARTQPAGGAMPDRVAAMDSGLEAPTLTGPAPRVVDRIDVGATDDLPPGFKVVGQADIGSVTPRQPFRPENVVPIPGNRVESLEEFNRIGDPRPLLKAPDETMQLAPRDYVVGGDSSRTVRRRGPLDLSAWLRTQGGVRDSGGELASMGVGPARRIDFPKGEAALGKLVHSGGMDLDEATFRAWEAGFFPDMPERPMVDDLVDALRSENVGGRRYFRPDDLDEVNTFYSTQAQRGAVETAEQEGVPLADDISEPVAQDDLAKLTPPDSAYEDAPRMVGKVGNLNLERVDNPEEVSRLVQHIAANVPEIAEARGTTVTNEELKQLANDLNVTPERILKWRKGSLPSPAEVFASRVIVHQGRQKIKELAKRARGASDEELAKFHNVVMKQAALERQLAGMAADAGRLLQQFNAVASAGDMSDAAIKAYLRGAGGRESVEDIADKLVDLVENPKAAGEFISKLPKSTTMEKVNEFWINSLLSGIPTHLVNFGGNGLVALLTLPEEALIATVGKMTRSADRAHLREVAVRSWGMMQGAREGLHAARIAFKTGEPLDHVSKVEARNYRAVPGKLGEFIRTPTKALSASDEFWSAMHRRGAINAGAMRRALNEKGTHAEKMARFHELRDNPDADLMKYAAAEALYRTFRKPLGQQGQWIQGVSNNIMGAKFVLPFVRTPINIIKYAGERSPLAPLALKPFLREIRAGGNKRDAALGKVVLGSGLAAFAAEAAVNGMISGGGPADYKEASALRNSGWKPYSIKIGDTWVSYQRFEPLSLIIGATADFVELGKWATQKEGDDIALGIATAIAKNITSKTWMSGLSDFFEVLSEPDRYGKRWASRMVGSLAVPAVIGNAARAVDPDMREVNDWLDAIKNRVPFLSHDLNVRRDVWGEPIKRGNLAGEGVGGALFNYVSPVNFGSMSKDPVRREVAKLQAPLSMPGRSIRVAGVNTKLTPEQYSYYVQLSGQPAKAYLSDFIKSPEWRDMTDDEKRDHLKDTMEEFRDSARSELKAMFPELAAEKDDLPEGFEVLPEDFSVVN